MNTKYLLLFDSFLRQGWACCLPDAFCRIGISFLFDLCKRIDEGQHPEDKIVGSNKQIRVPERRIVVSALYIIYLYILKT